MAKYLHGLITTPDKPTPKPKVPLAPVQPTTFEQLLPFSWRGIEFPVTQMAVDVAHDLVEHRYWGVDGARLEATGLAPTRFTASIPFTNGIVPGKGERWGVLYPTTMRQLLVAFQRRDDGIMQHPEFGPILCKAEKLQFNWSGDRRGGCSVEASWIQQNPEDVAQAVGSRSSPVKTIDVGALDLDASKTDLQAVLANANPPVLLPEYKKSLTEYARDLTGIVDQVGLLGYRATGAVDAILYRLDAMQGAVDRAKSALTWPVTQNIERLKEASRQVLTVALKADRHVSLLTVQVETTIAGLIPFVSGTSIADLIKLNPELMSNPVVPTGTVVRYYS